MNLRPYPGLTVALATALAGTTPLPAVADDSDEPMVEHCYIQAISAEEAAAGEVSEIDCYQVPAGTPIEAPAARGNITFAYIYDVSDTFGDVGIVNGPSCTGGSAVFGTGNGWDNRISATRLVSCGSAKHWASSAFTGSYQLVTGLPGSYHTMNATMNNATSSIEYAP
jgi:hypothetical protein